MTLLERVELAARSIGLSCRRMEGPAIQLDEDTGLLSNDQTVNTRTAFAVTRRFASWQQLLDHLNWLSNQGVQRIYLYTAQDLHEGVDPGSQHPKGWFAVRFWAQIP